MAISRHTFRHALPALLCGAFSLAAGPLASAVHATGSNVAGVAGTSVAGIAGVFDAGWSTAYYPQDSITHMHQRLHALGMDEVVLQYAAVEATHLYYPSQLDFLQNTQYKNNELFPKSIEAAKTAGTRIWLGLYYNGENWYTPPTAEQLDTLASRNLKVLEEIHSLYGSEAVVEGVYIPQEIARYYWDDLRDDATPEMLTEHFLKPVTEATQAKGWKVMAAPFYNQNLETPEKLQSFFEKLFAAGFKPDIIAVQDGNSDQIDKYYAYDIKSDMEAYKPRSKYQVKMRSKKPYSSWAVIKTYDTESAAKAYAKKASKSHSDMVYKVFHK